LVQGFSAPVAVMPFVRYQLMWLGAWGYLGVLAGSWAVGALPSGLIWASRALRGERWRARLRTEVVKHGPPVALILFLGSAIVVVVLWSETARAQERAFYQHTESPLSSAASKSSPVINWPVTSLASEWRSLEIGRAHV